MKMIMTIDLPNELKSTLQAVGYTPKRLSKEARCYLAAALVSRKVLNLEQAAQLADMSLWDFIPFLGEQGIAVADYNEEETQHELETALWLSQKLKK